MGLAVLATIIWSGNFIVARGVIRQIPPISLSFYRWGLATLILSPFVYKSFRQEWPVVRQHIAFFFWISLFGISLFNTFVYIGGHYTSAINLALIGTTSSPIMSNILARIFLKERIGWLKIAGMAVCITGVLFLLCKGDFGNLFTLHFSQGDGWVLLAAFAFSVYNTMVKKKPATVSPVNFLFCTFLLGTMLLFPFFLWEHFTAVAVKWTWTLGGTILYLGLGASVISFLLWNKAINCLGAGRASLFGNLIPVFSSLEAVIILHEEFQMMHVISSLLVFAGLVIANLGLFKKGRAV